KRMKIATMATRIHFSCWKLSRINLSIRKPRLLVCVAASHPPAAEGDRSHTAKKRDSLPIPSASGKRDRSVCYKDWTPSDGQKESRRRRYRLVSHLHRPPQAGGAGHSPRDSGRQRLVVLHQPKAESTEHR